MNFSEKVFIGTGLILPIIAKILYDIQYGFQKIASFYDLIPFSVDSVALFTVISTAFFAGTAIIQKRISRTLYILGYCEILISLLILFFAYVGFFSIWEGETTLWLLLVFGIANILAIPISICMFCFALIRK